MRICSLLCGVLLMASCSHRASTSQEKPVVLASIPPLASVVGELAGDRFEVISVSDKDTDPETYEPTAARRMRMGKADAFFMAGMLPYEPRLSQSLAKDNPAMLMVDTSEGIEPVHGTHVHHDAEGHMHDIDPHTWTSLRNGAVIASNVCDALVKLDPEGAPQYRANLQNLLVRLHSADSTVSAVLTGAPARAFVIWHPSLSYFARDYGLIQISPALEGKDATPAEIGQAISEARSRNAGVIFVQKQYDGRSAQALTDALDLRQADINPLDPDWVGQIIGAANAIARP